MPYALIAAAVIALGAAAPAWSAGRMYQWTDPATGHTHLSGHAPAWYRNGDGPRVLVFEGGRLVDDTARRVDQATGERLRAQAAARPPTDDEGQAASGDAAAADGPPPASAEDDAARVARLKALIAAWEALRTAQARAALGEGGQPQPAGGHDSDGGTSRRTGPEGGPADPSDADAPGRSAW